MNSIDLEATLAIILSLGIPIIAIVMTFIAVIRKHSDQTRLRLSLVEHATDPESARLLLAEQAAPVSSKYRLLRYGCATTGLGLGALAASLMGINIKEQGFLIAIILGLGLGMLAGFVAEYLLTRKHPESATDESLSPSRQ